MSFLSRFEVNAARRGARSLLASPQRMHSAVLSSFTADENGDAAHRTLWRIDTTGPHTWLYLVSAVEPDLTHLVEQAGWPEKVSRGWDTRSYDPFLDDLDVGEEWNFRLVANPTRTVTDPSGAKKNHPSITPAHQLAWLLDRAERLGIEIPDSSAGESDIVVSAARSRSFRHTPNSITVLSVAFEGRLVVTDPARLRMALTSGIGRAKAYGCGLMTLARA